MTTAPLKSHAILAPLKSHAILAPKGFIYIQNAIESRTAAKILAALNSEVDGKNQWRNITTAADSRHVIHYGFEYKYDRSGLLPAPPIPGVLTDTAAAVLAKLGMPPIGFDQHIVNKYAPGQGISPHIDHPKLFGGTILCITLSSGADIEFTKGSQVFRQYVEPLSAYVMSLDARYVWKHSIRARANDIVRGVRRARGTRISLTWRTTSDNSKIQISPIPATNLAALEPSTKEPLISGTDLDLLVEELVATFGV